MIKIAVCDDDRTVRESIVKALQRYERDNSMEFEILEYAAADAMLVSYPAELDLILLDIYMPGIDGMDAAKAIRRFDQDVCIIFITTCINVRSKGTRFGHLALSENRSAMRSSPTRLATRSETSSVPGRKNTILRSELPENPTACRSPGSAIVKYAAIISTCA